ncbi:hypothetical protein IEQ34_004941 [Dendrobium chrysotoxum]|uniref:Uncharacterized protein n=1 Tax=Dendrobium chrysotoxum TaxID=161865 RepID=A0AAV7HBJ8_DENCH|nr:hypothetical protein IEQ34_004941 [Dendrobium chrysotoxum]
MLSQGSPNLDHFTTRGGANNLRFGGESSYPPWVFSYNKSKELEEEENQESKEEKIKKLKTKSIPLKVTYEIFPGIFHYNVRKVSLCGSYLMISELLAESLVGGGGDGGATSKVGGGRAIFVVCSGGGATSIGGGGGATSVSHLIRIEFNHDIVTFHHWGLNGVQALKGVPFAPPAMQVLHSIEFIRGVVPLGSRNQASLGHLVPQSKVVHPKNFIFESASGADCVCTFYAAACSWATQKAVGFYMVMQDKEEDHILIVSCTDSGIPSCRQEIGGIVRVCISPYAFQQKGSSISSPWKGSSSTSDMVILVQGTESLQAKCMGGALTSYVPLIFV